MSSIWSSYLKGEEPMATDAIAQSEAPKSSSYWEFEEENEWEGETWTVYFEATAEQTPALEELAQQLEHREEYELTRLESLPEELPSAATDDVCIYAAYDEEPCEDCEGCYSGEGYFPAYSFRPLDEDKLRRALAQQGKNDADEDVLYKLGLFN